LKLILARHGETRWNAEGLILGTNDVPLSPRGSDQARALAGALAGELPFAFYASPLARALQTARIISEHLDVPFDTLEGIREADAGELVGLTVSQVRKRFPAFYGLWDEDPGKAGMPGGESLLQVQDRAWRAVAGLQERHSGDTVVAVTHHFVIHTLICRVLDVPLGYTRRLRVAPGSITRLEFSCPSGVLVSLNETGHLDPGV